MTKLLIAVCFITAGAFAAAAQTSPPGGSPIHRGCQDQEVPTLKPSALPPIVGTRVAASD